MIKHTLTATQTEIVRHGIRWATNILVELSGNYGKHLSETAACQLRVAIAALHECATEVGK